MCMYYFYFATRVQAHSFDYIIIISEPIKKL